MLKNVKAKVFSLLYKQGIHSFVILPTKEFDYEKAKRLL
jgi:hypothetical protein